MPRPTPGFVHPKLIDSLQQVGHFSSQCTLQEKFETRNTLGAEKENWEDIEGAINIPCEIGTPTRGMMGRELPSDSSKKIYSADYIIYLDRFVTDVENTDEYRVVVDNRPLNIVTFGHVDEVMTWFAVNEVH